MSERVDGLAYEVTGDGAPLVLAHAGIADRRMWDPIVDELAARYRVIRFDARGFGESEDPAGPWAPHVDLATVIAAASGDAVSAIGASMGGGVALDLALERPELFDRLVLVGSTPDGWEHHPSLEARFAEIDELLRLGDLDAANEHELETWMDGTRARGACDARARDHVAEVNRALLERQAELPDPVELEPPAIDRLASLAVSLLVAAGEYDQPSIRDGAELLADRTGARFVEIPGAAHLPALETPERFCEAVLPYLEGAVA